MLHHEASSNRFDVAIIGGGAAGLSAALVLGRSRRRVLVAHSGPTRNAPADAAHGFLTRDGTPPRDLLATGREQLKPYGVVIRDERAVTADRAAGGFAVALEDGSRIQARKLILATGVRDVLPEIPEFEELWGRGVFHCPYCHGWEVADEPLGLYGRGERGFELARLLRGWSHDLVLFTDGPAELSDEQRAQLKTNEITVREERVVRLVGESGRLTAVVLDGGGSVPRSGLFLKPAHELRSDLAQHLGCALTSDGLIEANDHGLTTVPGVYVAGDAGPNMQQLITAAASGAKAAIALNHELLTENFED
jgi:thioredoxin reductase